jgi:hypothetical protein
MKVLLVIGLLLVVNAILGLYRDWPRRSLDNKDQKANATITASQNKIRQALTDD